ncbi:MAG: HU family DNA-binding protein [Bacteroidales bacterium]|nr:HU family DNA-binding protein [Bacteroidales bacterium]
MNKSELIDAIAKNSGLTKTDSRKAYEGLVDAINAGLKKKDPITLIGFGTFSTVKREARTGRNPRTGEKIKIAAKKVVKFKPSKNLGK